MPEEEQASQVTPTVEKSPGIEEKYKIVFNQIDKRFVNLELLVGELNEKMRGSTSE